MSLKTQDLTFVTSEFESECTNSNVPSDSLILDAFLYASNITIKNILSSNFRYFDVHFVDCLDVDHMSILSARKRPVFL